MDKTCKVLISGLALFFIAVTLVGIYAGHDPHISKWIINDLGLNDYFDINNVNSIEEDEFVWNGHYALVRLEDISPGSDIVSLQNSVNVLKSKNIPFSIALIPIYKNPEKNVTIYLHEKPELVKILLDSNATIVLHGCTHQYDGETGTDFEFWDETISGPIKHNNTEYATKKIDSTLAELRKCNITVDYWETPHYTSDNDTKKVVSKYFTKLYEGETDKIQINEFGQIVVPTNLYYVDVSTPYESMYKILVKSQKISRNKNNEIVASFFFHPFLGTEYLETIITEMKNQGYKFTGPDNYIESVRKP